MIKLNKKEEKELLEIIIKDFKRDLMTAKVQLFIYEQEFYHPKNISKAKAEEGMAIYQKRIQYLSENIEAVKFYIEHFEL